MQTSLLIITIGILTGFIIYLLVKFRSSKKQMLFIDKQLVNYESIIDQANDAMLVVDIVDGRIHQSNPSASKMLGYSKEALEKCTLLDLHPKELFDKSSRVVADVWENGGLIYKDIPFITSEGEVLPVECSAKVAPFAGRPAIVIYARDIRERLKLEKEINEQKEIIEQKNKDITDSINYAKGIQKAMLTDKKELKKNLLESFILFMPKDIVSGDFYWVAKKNDTIFIAAIDCTGHGVPGAFMSVIGNSFLNEIVNEKKITEPAEILNLLRDSVVNLLKQKEGDSGSKDGMDIALFSINLKENILQFAGAYNPLWLIRKGELIETKGDKFPIGSFVSNDFTKFKNHKITLQKEDCIYVFTDGYADQFGGPRGKKFKLNQLKEILLSAQNKTMNEQKDILSASLEKWQGDLEQVDDILVIGIKF